MSIKGMFRKKVETEFGEMSEKRRDSIKTFIEDNVRTVYEAKNVLSLQVDWNKAGEIECHDFDDLEFVRENWFCFHCNECEERFTNIKDMVDHIFVCHKEFLED